MKVSFVIPCYNSAGLVGQVITEIKRTVDDRYEYEIIAVNDGSPDNVIDELKEYAKEDKRLKVVSLARNMGKHAALMAGFSFVDGDVIVGVDDDGQCPIDHLSELLEPLKNGYDISVAKYPVKKESRLKRVGSSVNDWMTCYLLGKPKDLKISNFYAMKRFICNEILRYANPYPYIDGLMLRTTKNIKNVEMEERNRISGNTGYTFKKSLGLLLNGFTAFSVKPLRLASILGILLSTIGFFAGLYVIARKIIYADILAGYSSLMAVQLFIGGIIMLLLGLIGEYLGRIYICINNSPQYVIRETVNCGKFATEEKVS